MNILLLNSLGIYGGGEFFVYQLASYIASKEHKVWVGCRKDTPLHIKCKDADINTVCFDYPEKGTGMLGKNVKQIKEFIVENGIQLVHSNTNYDRTAGAAAAELAGIKHAASVHSLESISHNLTHWARNKFFVDMFIADGNIVKEFLIREDKIDERKIKVINLGINPESFKRDELLRENVRGEFGIGSDEILIGNLGRLVEFKGHAKLIKAFKLISEKNSKVKLMIIGDGELKINLENLAVESGLDRRVIFAGFRNDLQAVYSAFDIYTHTSNESGGELFPFAVLYAMAAELPVVSTGVGEIPNMVIDGLNGFISGHSAEDIASKILILTEDLIKLKVMGNEGKRRLNNEFTLDKMGRSILKLYNEMLSIRNI